MEIPAPRGVKTLNMGHISSRVALKGLGVSIVGYVLAVKFRSLGVAGKLGARDT